MLVDVRAHGPPIEAGARDLLRVLRAERDDHRQRVDVHLVIDRAADVAHRRDQRLEHALPARLTALGEGVDAADGHDGHRAGAGRMAALDVERLPGRPRLVLGEAAGDLAGPRLRGLLHAVGPGTAEVAHDQTERAADRRVRLDVPAEAGGVPADAEPPRD